MNVKPLSFRVAMTLITLLLLLPLLAVAQENDPPTEGQEYTVQRSDTLWKLAEKYLGDGNLYPAIIDATALRAESDDSIDMITDAEVIQPGQTIWIPAEVEITPQIRRTATPIATTTSIVMSTTPTPAQVTSVDGLDGQIAFSFWNASPQRCTYEVNIIQVSDCLAGDTQCQATRRIVPLNNISEPALSPDGTTLAFRGWGPIPDEIKDGQAHPYASCAPTEVGRWLQTTTLDGTSRRDVTGFFEDSHPDWSPDGNRVLFDTGRNGDGITRLLFFYADSGAEEELQIAGEQPSWAPDNERLVYRGCDNTGNRCGLWLANAIPLRPFESGANLIGPLIEGPELAHPDWSPVGETIVYQSPEAGSWDLYLINADGTGKRQLTSDAAIEGLPAWSPDGEWIAYLSNQGGNWGIWVIRADGTEAQQLFTFDGGEFTPKPIIPYGPRDWLDEQISWSR